ncbi:discoidin domain-containing protein [Actinokineospora soli]|uniref:Discoidin domain-containing protein n=1 Tax=Actinokineospora soli TaxID=1048753 RepID=A0ABW2TQG4_9PSEU
MGRQAVGLAVVGFALSTVVAIAPSAGADPVNLALGKPATGSAACSAGEGPEKAVNGSVSGGNSDKWCSSATARQLQVDLGAEYGLTGFAVKHAEAGGESPVYNTWAFGISTSADGVTWTQRVSVTGNTGAATTHSIATANARYARLDVVTPTQNGDQAARIYEFEVYGGAPAQASNVALGKPVTAAVPCTSSEGGEKAVTGSLADKWCSRSATRQLDVDLRDTYAVTGFVVKHAEAGGESPAYNTRAFTISTSADGVTWTQRAAVSGNTGAVSTQSIAAADARHVRLTITTPTQNGDQAARVYEFEVWGTPTTGPGTVALFDRVPMFGMYSWEQPDYTPPPGVLMWNRGTEYARKLSDLEKSRIGADAELRITYHAQCDNYDRIGTTFMISVPRGQTPTAETPRTTLRDFITPFSNYWQGAKATYQFPAAPIGVFAKALADPDRDTWIGIGGGSNPRPDDACQSRSVEPAFRKIGFKYSLSVVSSAPVAPGDRDVVSLMAGSEQKTNAITAGPAPVGAQQGVLAVTIAGYGSDDGGEEYSSTTVAVKVNDKAVGSFSTGVDCAAFEQHSPDGNVGIFRNNLTTNPRSWCPGDLVRMWTAPVDSLGTGPVTVKLTHPRTSPFSDSSFYRTSVALAES